MLNYLVKHDFTDIVIDLLDKYPKAILKAMESTNHKSILHELAMLEREFYEEDKIIAI